MKFWEARHENRGGKRKENNEANKYLTRGNYTVSAA